MLFMENRKKYLPFLGVVLLANIAMAQPELVLSPADFPPEPPHQCVSPDLRASLLTPTWVDETFKPSATEDFPIMAWPLGNRLYEDIFLMNYYDTSAPGSINGNFVDYNCGGSLGYDGHTGTDVTVFNFDLMDQGMPILATADGVVAQVVYDLFDRNYNPPYATSGANLVRILHDDGSQSLYIHMRKNSIAVNVGEEVTQGQFLGYVGSSGWTPMPHLHLELWEPGSTGFSDFTSRDPWEGDCNNQSSLWEEQLDYVPDNDIWIMDWGITTETALGGNVFNLTDTVFKNRVENPWVFGADEPFMTAWIQLQAPVGDSYRIDIYDPTGNLFVTSGTQVINNYIRYWWHPFTWAISGATEADYGTWTMSIFTNGEWLLDHNFDFGETSYYLPRLHPLSGKSIRLEGAVIQDTLKMSPLSNAVQFDLYNHPEYVSIQDNMVSISAEANVLQPCRNEWFEVIAIDSEDARDTMRYHLIAPNQPLDCNPTSTENFETNNFRIREVYPNPTNGNINLAFEVEEQHDLVIALYDPLGKQLVELQSQKTFTPGIYVEEYQLEDVPNGLYFLKVESQDGTAIKKLILSK